jgi:hypothetical protein
MTSYEVQDVTVKRCEGEAHPGESSRQKILFAPKGAISIGRSKVTSQEIQLTFCAKWLPVKIFDQLWTSNLGVTLSSMMQSGHW